MAKDDTNINPNEREKNNSDSDSSAPRKSNARKTNEEQAQDEWTRKMHERMSLEEGGEEAEDESEQENAEKKKEKSEKKEWNKILGDKKKLWEQPIEITKRNVYQETVSETYTGDGIRFTRTNVMPFLLKATDVPRNTTAKAMLFDLRKDEEFRQNYKTLSKLKDENGKSVFKRLDTSSLSMQDIYYLKKNGLKELEKRGIYKSKTKDPIFILVGLKKKKVSGRIKSNEEKAIYDVVMKTTAIEAVHTRKQGRLYTFSKKKLKTELEKDDTGREISRFLKDTKMKIRIGKRVIRMFAERKYSPAVRKKSSRISQLNAKIQSLQSIMIGKGAGKNLEVQSTPGVFEERIQKPGSKGIRSLFDGKKEFSFLKKSKEKSKERKKEIPGTVRRIIQRGKKMIQKFTNLFFGKEGFLKVIAGLLGSLIMVIVVIVIITGVISVITNAVNFDSKSDEVKNLCFDTIEECYNNQISILSNYNSAGLYDSVVIKNVDKKSNEAYQDTLPYTETTNTTEMISMAIIYFEGDLEGVTEEELKTYLRGLYYGSHVISASDDGSGSVTVTVTTYYFDDLFDVALSDYQSNGSVISGTRIDIPQTFTQVTTYEPYNYENLDGKHYWSYTCRDVWKAWTANGQLADEGLCYINIGGTKFYLIAVYEPTFGKVGDYIDFYFPDSNYVLHGIIADTKGNDIGLYRASNGIIYGHKAGSGCSVIEFMLKYQSRSNPGSVTHGYGGPGHSNWHPEMSGNALYAVNGGSYFTSPGGPQFSYSTDSTSEMSETFLSKLSDISAFIKLHHSQFTKGSGKKCTYQEMIKKVNAGEKNIYIDCGMPTSWAVQSMGLVSNQVYINGGQLSSGAKALIRTGKVVKITDSSIVGKTIKQASDQGLLEPGDILLNGGAASHTCTYAGKDAEGHPLCYEAGGYAKNKGYGNVGCGPLDYYSQTQYKIKCVLRWR